MRTKWEPDGYLEADSFCGPPHVIEAHVSAALPQIRDAIAHAETGLTPAARPQIIKLIGTLRLSKNAARMAGNDAAGRIAAMVEEISDIPADILRDAVWEIRTSGDEARDDWFPTGGQIRSHAMPEMQRRMLRLRRLKEWADELERRAARQAEMERPLSPEQQSELDRLNARRKAALYEPSEDDPPPGITLEEWREMLAEAREKKSARDGLGRGYE